MVELRTVECRPTPEYTIMVDHFVNLPFSEWYYAEMQDAAPASAWDHHTGKIQHNAFCFPLHTQSMGAGVCSWETLMSPCIHTPRSMAIYLSHSTLPNRAVSLYSTAWHANNTLGMCASSAQEERNCTSSCPMDSSTHHFCESGQRVPGVLLLFLMSHLFLVSRDCCVQIQGP